MDTDLWWQSSNPQRPVTADDNETMAKQKA